MLTLVAPDAVLETPRLLLEPLRERHAETLFPVLADPRIYAYLDEDPPETVATLAARYRRLETRRSAAGDQLWLNWALRRRDDDAWLGYVQATVFDDDRAEIAYVLGPAHWRAGYATEACRRLLDLLFGDYRRTLVLARFDRRNRASEALLARLGFAADPSSEPGEATYILRNR